MTKFDNNLTIQYEVMAPDGNIWDGMTDGQRQNNIPLPKPSVRRGIKKVHISVLMLDRVSFSCTSLTETEVMMVKKWAKFQSHMPTDFLNI